MKKPFFQIIIALLGLTFAVQPTLAAFSDVSADHPYSHSIEQLKEEGILQGHPDGRFKPSHQINRAEFVHLIAQAFLNDAGPKRRNCFPDVSAVDWFEPSVCQAKHTGLIQGYPDGSFGAINSINFAEAAQILVTAFGYTDLAQDPEIWFRPAINVLGQQKAIPPSIQSFTHELTRAEMAEMISRLMNSQHNSPSLVLAGDRLIPDPNQNYSLEAFRQELINAEQAEEADIEKADRSEEQEPSETAEPVETTQEGVTPFSRRWMGTNAPVSTTPSMTTPEESSNTQPGTQPANPVMKKATWIWNHGSSTPQELVDLTLSEGFNEVYLSSYDPDWAGGFIADMHAKSPSVSVQLIAEGHCALEIDPTCGTQHLTVYSDPQQVKDYIKLDEVNQWLSDNGTGLRVSGIHYDVEAYHGAGTFWQCQNGGSYGKCTIDNYLEMVRTVLLPLQQEGFTQSVVWGSSRNTTPDPGSTYSADFQQLITNPDYQAAIESVVILAYHDEHTVADVTQAFQVANASCSASCPGIIPAIETENIGIDVVSFAEEGRAAADAAAQSHVSTHGQSAFFGGVGIHWLIPYTQLN